MRLLGRLRPNKRSDQWSRLAYVEMIKEEPICSFNRHDDDNYRFNYYSVEFSSLVGTTTMPEVLTT
jgi:hypothetical protein